VVNGRFKKGVSIRGVRSHFNAIVILIYPPYLCSTLSGARSLCAAHGFHLLISVVVDSGT
jgi:hypothetical protein